MTIDADVADVARKWGLDAKLLQAVVVAEGGGLAIVKAVQCSLPHVTTRAQALDVLARSCAHALNDFVKQTTPGSFVDFWAARWCPVGALNDPHGLNVHWAPNVYRLWSA